MAHSFKVSTSSSTAGCRLQPARGILPLTNPQNIYVSLGQGENPMESCFINNPVTIQSGSFVHLLFMERNTMDILMHYNLCCHANFLNGFGKLPAFSIPVFHHVADTTQL